MYDLIKTSSLFAEGGVFFLAKVIISSNLGEIGHKLFYCAFIFIYIEGSSLINMSVVVILC